MSDPYGNPLPPRHGEDEDWGASAAMPICPECGGLVRRWTFALAGTQGRRGWRCDIHGEVGPEWVYDDEEESHD